MLFVSATRSYETFSVDALRGEKDKSLKSFGKNKVTVGSSMLKNCTFSLCRLSYCCGPA